MTTPHVLLDRFLLAKEAAGLSPRTLQWYEEMVRAYLAWLEQWPALAFDMPEAIDGFLAHERRRNLAASSIQGRYRALSAWFGWLMRRELLARDPMAAIDRPAVPKKRMRHVKLAEFLSLYRSIRGDTWLDYRDREIILIMLFSGLRVSEVCGLTPQDVDVAQRMIRVRNGKGGDDRDVPCAPDVADVHARYLLTRPAYSGPALFVSHDGYAGARGALTANGIRQMLRRRCEAAGLPVYNPHAFRHGFAMLFLNAGMALSAVSEAMGHSSEQTTRIYAHWLKDGLTQAYEDTMRRFDLGE